MLDLGRPLKRVTLNLFFIRSRACPRRLSSTNKSITTNFSTNLLQNTIYMEIILQIISHLTHKTTVRSPLLCITEKPPLRPYGKSSEYTRNTFTNI